MWVDATHGAAVWLLRGAACGAMSAALSATVSAQTPDVLRSHVAGMRPAVRADAEAYLAAPAGDTAARMHALVGLQVQDDTAGAAFLITATPEEPNAAVRCAAIAYSSYRPALRARPNYQALLWHLAADDPDSAVAHTATAELRMSEARMQLDTLERRVSVAKQRGAVPAWLAREEQLAIDRAHGVVVPAFVHDPPPVFAAAPADRPIRVVAFGDWGTSGDAAQQHVAAQVRAYHAQHPFTFGITLGDNFYGFPRPDRPDSPRWRTDYEALYSPMGIPFYVALGNHDYNVPDQIASEYAYSKLSPTWRFPATWYTYTAGYTQFFVIDGLEMGTEQLAWLQAALDSSHARWKIVYGHFPMRVALPPVQDSATNPYIQELRDRVGRLMPVLRGRADVYISGHHHSMQHLQPFDGVQLFIAGSGGRHGYSLDPKNPISLFADNQTGFLVLDIARDTIGAHFVAGETGKVLYETTIRKKPT